MAGMEKAAWSPGINTLLLFVFFQSNFTVRDYLYSPLAKAWLGSRSQKGSEIRAGSLQSRGFDSAFPLPTQNNGSCRSQNTYP
jgi:hypothetical protein